MESHSLTPRVSFDHLSNIFHIFQPSLKTVGIGQVLGMTLNYIRPTIVTKDGDERVEDVVGPSGKGTVNERGCRLIQWCQSNDFTIKNTWYQNHPGDSGLGRAPEIEIETKYITSLFRKRFRNVVKTSKALPGAHCDFDLIPSSNM
ncbi:craniofacial development protein 2-like [Plakobranchus ocellatus]|uniref:Craniofacial development protein 2-like n=1 Tax=Plakobranchus ocellatus TaxID=259542 RepID=A0AAV3ZCW8_9GAST|nr:craniofacial development protein 2-like [Plakobranchus ocellatus]